MTKNNKPFLVCLTGGVASGKTLVSDEMALLGIEVIDTDIIARFVVTRGSKGLMALVNIFGSEIININGSLNRVKLRELVFSDAVKLEKLNAVVHPMIREEVVRKISECESKIVVVVIPLYSGQKGYRFFDRVCVVDVQESIQLSRLQSRDGIDIGLAKKMMESQIDRNERLALANDVICNKKSVEDLIAQVKKMVLGYHFFAEADNASCQ